jgi:hypothetical protein
LRKGAFPSRSVRRDVVAPLSVRNAIDRNGVESLVATLVEIEFGLLAVELPIDLPWLSPCRKNGFSD